MASHSSILLALKNLPAMSETWVRFLGQEDPLKKGMATYSIIFFYFFFKLINLFYFTRLYWFCPGEFHGQRRLAGYSPWGHKELDTPEHECMQYNFTQNSNKVSKLIAFIFSCSMSVTVYRFL